VIPELRALTEDRADVIGELLPLLPRDVTEHLGVAACGMQDACEHFDGGGFARAVGTDEAEQFACVHLKGKPAHRFDGAILRLEQ
jgi:hypothetical protein